MRFQIVTYVEVEALNASHAVSTVREAIEVAPWATCTDALGRPLGTLVSVKLGPTSPTTPGAS